MSLLDFRLNGAIDRHACTTATTAQDHFALRAAATRQAERFRDARAYDGFYTVPLPNGFFLLIESTAEDSGLPPNRCAEAHFGVPIRGAALVVQHDGSMFSSLTAGSIEDCWQTEAPAAVQSTQKNGRRDIHLQLPG